ncbi:MAG: hypothetical protein CR972_03420 [Candidatus Moraniibacteriota bacterium]|nr:MAG: hypothetical protein CR972_03420 [Candidatus Moranbacteria bacterium]
MKIAIDIRNIGKKRTGDEVVFFELVRHLTNIDCDNEYHLLIDNRPEEDIIQIKNRLRIAQKKNFTIVQVGSGNKFVWNGWMVSQYCRQEKIDIYHTQYIVPIFMPKFTKIVTHIHDVSFRVYKNLISKKDSFFLNTLIPWSLRRADKIIAVSQFTKEEIIKFYHVPEDKIFVVHNASSMICNDVNMETIRVKYHLPQKYILTLGTMQPRKNIPCVIRAFAQIADKIPDTFLVLAGKKAHNFDETIEKIIADKVNIKNRIIFTGYIDEEDKCAVYAMADVFVFPSLYEGFGVPILEALCAGVPVIASNIAPHKEVAGNAVKYFDPKNIDQCARVLYDVLDNDNIRKTVDTIATMQKEKFSWHKSAKDLYMIYQSFL